ncbi:hypothetical protein T440DRAFT_473002 [Plenodomus tracheiphilus IPT5]|uniref:Stress-response A/B barrel domain-containing protein n=1 Tax=Plenodomus tracheiphilus IPT5 TaxID=1408161 RepID=A0A6A7ARW4_9PLEO|nr:hypothetical protein T440DRAFT_473002 [Plenodomus tracheiphilus IPT5]
MPVRRVTMFKISKESDRTKLLDLYKDMPSKAVKNGRPYILSVEAGTTQQDARAQGYTIAATSVFESEEDLKYYDEGCEAHAELRGFVRSVSEGFLMVYFTV